MPEAVRSAIYEFADFRVDVAKRLLFRGDVQVTLTPKVFETLLALVEHRDEVVEKDQLMNILWPDSFVEESNLVQNIAVLRKALGENPKDHKFVLTVPGRGYRFVAEISALSNGVEPSSAVNQSHMNGANAAAAVPVLQGQSEETPVFLTTVEKLRPEAIYGDRSTTSVTRFFRPAIFSLAAIAIIGLVSVSYYRLTRPHTTPATTGSRLAVLPLKPINAESRDPIIEFAIAESLILKISESKNFSVLPLNSVRRFVELDTDAVEAGRQLNVDLVLSSNYQVADGKIRVTSQLMNTRTGETEGTFKSDADTTNAFAMQDLTADQIGNAFFARFGKGPNTFAAKRGTESEEAYRLYLQGMDLVEKGGAPETARAIEMFDEALKLDAAYAQAWAGSAHAHCSYSHSGGLSPDEEYRIAIPALSKALELNNGLADAYGVQGIINSDYKWDFAAARKSYERSIELDPNFELTHRWYAYLLTKERRTDEAISQIQKAIEINPASPSETRALAFILYSAGRYDEALQQLERTLEIDPGFSLAYDTLWKVYTMMGDHEKAYRSFVKYQQLAGADAAQIARLSAEYAKSGWHGALRTALEMMKEKTPPNSYSPASYRMADISAVVGDRERAFQYLNEALKYRRFEVSYMAADPLLNSLIDDPRYKELRQRAGI